VKESETLEPEGMSRFCGGSGAGFGHNYYTFRKSEYSPYEISGKNPAGISYNSRNPATQLKLQHMFNICLDFHMLNIMLNIC
jgi:hypothetical protein